MIDAAPLEQTRQVRRNLLQKLKEHQLLDSRFASELKVEIEPPLKLFLSAVSNYLKELAFASSIGNEDKDIFNTLSNGMAIEAWQRIFSDLRALNLYFEQAKTALNTANAALDKLAPWGFFSKLGSTDAEQRIIKLGEEQKDNAAKRMLAAENRKAEHEGKAEKILKDCIVRALNLETLKKISRSRLTTEITSTANRLREFTTAKQSEYTALQMRNIFILEEACSALRTINRNTQATL